MDTILAVGRRVRVFAPQGDVNLKIWTHMGNSEAQALFDLLPEGVKLFAADDYDWNADLSPWPAEKCFKGGIDFAGKGKAQLNWLNEAVAQLDPDDSAPRAILGYSLAGLFAVWAVAEGAPFQMAASVSGSLWYDGFVEYLRKNAAKFAGKRAYFSVGDKEAKTRNPRLCLVQECTEQAAKILEGAGAQTVFELNPGNHFVDSAKRCAKAVRCFHAVEWFI